MPHRESTVIAGDYARVSIFPVRKPAVGRRRCKAVPTSDVQTALNERNRQHRFYDLVHANFTDRDIFQTLTYDDAHMPDTPEAAQKNMQNYFRRIKSLCKKRGVDAPRYLYVTERGESTGRIHHHIFLACELSRDEIEAAWGKGYANSRRMEFGENGVEGLVKYSLKSGVHRPDENDEKVGYRTYSGSKNLIQPVKRQNDYRIRAKDLAYIDAHPDDLDFVRTLYPGWIVTRVEPTARGEYEADKSPIPHAHFVTLYMYRADALDKKKKKHRKERGR